MARRQEHFTLPRRDPPRRLRARHLPAGRRPHDLLQSLEVPLPRRQLRRRARPHPHRSSPAPATGRTAASPSRSPADPAPRRPGRSRRRGRPAPTQQFFFRAGGEWTPAGPPLDASLISDEGGRGEHGSFTGAFVGLLAFDTSGRAAPADFTIVRLPPGLMPDRRRFLMLSRPPPLSRASPHRPARRTPTSSPA